MQVPDASVPVSLRLPRAGRERLLALMATGERQFVLASLDGSVSHQVTIVPDELAGIDGLGARLGDATIDWEDGRLERCGCRVSLSSTERRLLACLLDASEESVVSREQLIGYIWPRQAESACQNGLAVYVHYLRQKLAAVGLADALQTVRGVGYRLGVPRPAQSKSA